MIPIRTATERDVDALLEYVASLRAERLPTIFRHERAPTREEELDFVRKFARADASLFVALDGDRIVGNLAIAAHEHPESAHGAEIGMSVLAAYRGRGVGSRLLDTAIAWARRHSLRRLELEVRSNNPGARRLYERKGFAIEGIRRGAHRVDGTSVDALRMALFLEPAA
jgi:RimJ/RimL family protein N-acetyltransferase